MSQRSSPRLLAGPDLSMVTFRKRDNEDLLRGSLLDQSDDGLAIQLGRRSPIEVDEQVEVRVGDTWQPAIVTSTKRQGISHRIGLRWLAPSQAVSSPNE